MCLPLGSHCHTCSYFCVQIFCRETVRDHTKLLSFEFILNTRVSPCFLSHELLLQGFCHSWYPPTLMLVTAESISPWLLLRLSRFSRVRLCATRPHRWQHTRLCCPWDSPGKITGVGCHFLLQ